MPAKLPRASAGAVYHLPADERRGVFRALAGRPMFVVYLLLVNLPYGIVTTLAARAMIGEKL